MKEITVICPDEPPQLTPGAARSLLRISLDARERQLAASQEPDKN